MKIFQSLNFWLETVTVFIWFWPIVIFILATGVYYTISTRFLQLRFFRSSFQILSGKYIQKRKPKGEISHFRALTAALSATVGLGNIAGVAFALQFGGPGAIFWMWVTGFLGMVTKFVEVTLATYYREKINGVWQGSTMLIIEKGLGKKWKWLAFLFASCFFVATFNTFQVNQITQVLVQNFAVSKVMIGVVICGLVALVIFNGLTVLGRVTSILVPIMCGVYLLAVLTICLLHPHQAADAFLSIIKNGLGLTQAAAGGVGMAIIWGVRRAVFSCEAGMGTAPMVHSTARTDHPVRQGTVALIEPFIDTILVCTGTGVVIIMSDLLTTSALSGSALTAAAFDKFLPPLGLYIVIFAVGTFGYSTIITGNHYGTTVAMYLFGPKIKIPYKVVFCAMVFLGSFWSSQAAMNFADLTLGITIIPNIIAILALRQVVFDLIKDYQKPT
jgi:AGCS family alanine or glycine:cation symporter